MHSTSSAVRTKAASSTARSEIFEISVARCGRMVRKPSLDRRKNASRTGWRETFSCFATSASDTLVPGGSCKEITAE